MTDRFMRNAMWLSAFLAPLLVACDPATAQPAVPRPPAGGEVALEAELAGSPAAFVDDPTPLPEPEESGGGQRLLAICGEIHGDLADAVGLSTSDFLLRPADVPNAVWGNILDGCRLSWSGPGANLAFGRSAVDLPAFKAQRALLRAGWEEDADHMQDQPGGFVRGFVQGNKLCLLAWRFRPPTGRPCPADDPVTCGLGPAELDYDISLSCAEY